MTTSFEDPNGVIITGFTVEDEWVVITYQDPVSSPVPLVVKDHQVRIRREPVESRLRDVVIDIGDILNEAARLEGNVPDSFPQR